MLEVKDYFLLEEHGWQDAVGLHMQNLFCSVLRAAARVCSKLASQQYVGWR